ncbi:UDP-N-acetylmuramate:L-alanyl-gamma-D-glutamyl-meso-diaminopimelate ligase [bacterium]|nr:UDP-N-acetylmuramate:L-alanyl-gamma-D-glutamyl-meso-diaminopimelate ligase [bacterium]
MHVHLVAICGTGMGALAALLTEAGHRVTGSDQNVYPPMSTFLAAKGIDVKLGYRAENLLPRPDLVVIGNAIRRENPEAVAAIEAGLPYLSFPGALRRFFISDKTTIAICGTHGKTTTTALAAWVMTHAGLDPSFLVGGLGLNFDAPVRLGAGAHFVVEGDEYDTAFFDKVPKFLRYEPKVAVISNIEFDHADIYPDLDAILAAFEQLVRAMPGDGLIIAGIDDANVRRVIVPAKARVLSFGFDEHADIRARTISPHENGVDFIIETAERSQPVRLPMFGEHNVRNALAAYAVARHAGVEPTAFAAAIEDFRGVRRRLEIRGEAAGVTVIDDFGHHPTAIATTLAGLRSRFANRRVVALYEPRTNTSRRNFFQDAYARAFAGADAVVIAPVYEAAAIPEDERFDSARLRDDLAERGIDARVATDYEETLTAALDVLGVGDVAVLFSNGGFGGLHERLLAALRGRK